MKRCVAFLLHIYVSTSILHSQTVQQINKVITRGIALQPLYFLASDELMGRSPMRSEINVAARYISEQFRSAGVREVKGTNDYFQTFQIETYSPSAAGVLSVGAENYILGSELLQMQGGNVNVNAPVIFIGYSSGDGLEKTDVAGKIVVTNFGYNDSSTFSEGWQAVSEQRRAITAKQAVALIVRYKPANITWEQLQHHFGEPRVNDEARDSFPVFIVNDAKASLQSAVGTIVAGKVVTSGGGGKTVPAKNVIGWIQGTDAKLKDQFIVLTAHYDHVGVAAIAKMEEGKRDSIFNGARDNAIGVTAVINAARYFAAYPPRRSILFIAYTAEELGLIGSRYFSSNPLVPLRNLVYNLNIDNASYNDTTLITVVGLGRTSADEDIKKACTAYGLTAKPDPAPEQELFDRSDNVNLAAKGIPAPTFSLGMRSFDSTVMKRYHQLSDETGNVDQNYMLKYIRAYVLAAKNIADNPAQPSWNKNDKYEAAYKQLYSNSK